MLQNILSALAVYISTSIDYLFILLIIFSQNHTKKVSVRFFWSISWNRNLGSHKFVCSICAKFYSSRLDHWSSGTNSDLFRDSCCFCGRRGGRRREVVEKLGSRGTNRLFWTVSLITIASGGDNLGIYIPFFTSLSFFRNCHFFNRLCYLCCGSLLY